MSRDASVILSFGDGKYRFRLGWGELANVQESCDAGPFVTLERLKTGACRLQEIADVLLWGLIGGGLAPVDASKLIDMFVKARPPAENRLIAYAVMAAGCHGAPEEQIEKKSAAPDRDKKSTTSLTGRSGSERSTQQVPNSK
ncbi:MULTISPECIES: GTA-gp10 family protein [unclassified Bradyrhizobium]